jgi:hypothetical protein
VVQLVFTLVDNVKGAARSAAMSSRYFPGALGTELCH